MLHVLTQTVATRWKYLRSVHLCSFKNKGKTVLSEISIRIYSDCSDEQAALVTAQSHRPLINLNKMTATKGCAPILENHMVNFQTVTNPEEKGQRNGVCFCLTCSLSRVHKHHGFELNQTNE